LRLVSVWTISVAALLASCGIDPPCRTPSTSLVFPYVGQGHGIALVVEHRAVVFDAGPPDQAALAQALRQAGVDTIAAIFLTHPDLDHWGGLDSLVGSFPVERLVHGPVDSARREATFARVCGQILSGCDTTWRGDRNWFSGIEVETLWPDSGKIFTDPNDGSLALRATLSGNRSLLVTGDLDTLGELALLPDIHPVTVLQLGHHGSRSSGHLRFLGAASPKQVIVQYGIDNSYGHPTAEALSRVKAVGATLLDPAQSGARVVVFEGVDCSI